MKVNNILLVLNMIGADINKLYDMIRDAVPEHIKLDMNISLNGMFMSLRGLQEYDKEYVEDLFSKIDFQQLYTRFDIVIGVSPMNEDGPTFSVRYDYETKKMSIEEKEIDTVLGKVVMTAQKENQYNFEKWNLIHKFRNDNRIIKIEVDDNYRYGVRVPDIFTHSSLKYLDVNLSIHAVTKTLQTIADSHNNVMTANCHQIFMNQMSAPFSPHARHSAGAEFCGSRFTNAQSIYNVISMYINLCITVEDVNTKDVNVFYFTFLQ